jgi:hypothetical protein
MLGNPIIATSPSPLFLTMIDYGGPKKSPSLSTTSNVARVDASSSQPKVSKQDVKKEVKEAQSKVTPLLIPVHESERKPVTYPTTWEEFFSSMPQHPTHITSDTLSDASLYS